MSEKRILLIEGEATTRQILTEVLRGEGYKVDSVATAGAATTCLESIRYALVVADWVLPDGDGTDVADTAAQLWFQDAYRHRLFIRIAGGAGRSPSVAAE